MRRHRLAPSERFSRIVQWIIRRWTFVALYTSASLFVWYSDGYFRGGFFHALLHDPTLAKWNALASLGALVIESSVGIGVWSSQKRDTQMLQQTAEIAQELREMNRISRHSQQRMESELLAIKLWLRQVYLEQIEDDGLAHTHDPAWDEGAGRGEGADPPALPPDGEL